VPEIRCASKKHGEITENSKGEFRRTCNSRFCKKLGNEIVEHIWNLEKINENQIVFPIDTKRYKRPEVRGIIK